MKLSRNKEQGTRNKNLVVEVEGKTALVEWGGRRVCVELKSQSLLAGIAKVVKEPRAIKEIIVTIGQDATFSTTRQVVAVANTLAWQLGVKVNRKKQMRASYSGQPNITKPHL